MDQTPKPLLAKLGLKTGTAIAVLGFSDRSFMEDWEYETCLKQDTKYDSILIQAADLRALSGIHGIKSFLTLKGMIWIVYPKGVKTITQHQVFFAGNAEGFTDCKVCSFSETHTALKFVRRRKIGR